LKFSRGPLAKCIFPIGVFYLQIGKSYKIIEESKNCIPNFVVLCASTFPEHVYTFELQFLLEKLKCEIPRSVILQNPYMLLSWILDML
jgi:hypothetical protein